jgi:hypothetical protein
MTAAEFIGRAGKSVRGWRNITLTRAEPVNA